MCRCHLTVPVPYMGQFLSPVGAHSVSDWNVSFYHRMPSSVSRLFHFTVFHSLSSSVIKKNNQIWSWHHFFLVKHMHQNIGNLAFATAWATGGEPYYEFTNLFLVSLVFFIPITSFPTGWQNVPQSMKWVGITIFLFHCKFGLLGKIILSTLLLTFTAA